MRALRKMSHVTPMPIARSTSWQTLLTGRIGSDYGMPEMCKVAMQVSKVVSMRTGSASADGR